MRLSWHIHGLNLLGRHWSIEMLLDPFEGLLENGLRDESFERLLHKGLSLHLSLSLLQTSRTHGFLVEYLLVTEAEPTQELNRSVDGLGSELLLASLGYTCRHLKWIFLILFIDHVDLLVDYGDPIAGLLVGDKQVLLLSSAPSSTLVLLLPLFFLAFFLLVLLFVICWIF